MVALTFLYNHYVIFSFSIHVIAITLCPIAYITRTRRVYIFISSPYLRSTAYCQIYLFKVLHAFICCFTTLFRYQYVLCIYLYIFTRVLASALIFLKYIVMVMCICHDTALFKSCVLLCIQSAIAGVCWIISNQ